MNFTGIPVKRAETDIFGLSCFIINITDRQTAERALLEKENRFKELF